MIVILIVIYVFTVAFVTAVTLLGRAALGDRKQLLAAMVTPLACEGVILMMFANIEGGMNDITRRVLYLYGLLLPGGMLGASSRWR